MKIGHWHSGFGFQVSVVKKREPAWNLTPDTWNLCSEKALPRPIMSKK